MDLRDTTPASADEPIHLAAGYSYWKTREEEIIHWRGYKPIDKIGVSLWGYGF